MLAEYMGKDRPNNTYFMKKDLIHLNFKRLETKKGINMKIKNYKEYLI